MLTEKQKDKIKGVIYGQAIGDALGLGTEFLSKKEVEEYYPEGLLHYNQIVQDEHRQRWKKGDWTDDTDQMLCILDSIIKCERIDINDIAEHFYQWFEDSPMGIGRTVLSVLARPDFLSDPHKAAEHVWTITGKKNAANGAVMRTSILGVWEYEDIKMVKHNAEAVCKITHFDPKCVASCVAVSMAISLLINDSFHHTIIKEQCLQYDRDFEGIYNNALDKNISTLQLCDDASIGYTYKAMSAGFWALENAESFESGILDIIHEGGDADTNASVAGALLGAKFGFNAIPEIWSSHLLYKKRIDEKIDNLISILDKAIVLLKHS